MLLEILQATALSLSPLLILLAVIGLSSLPALTRGKRESDAAR